MNSEAFAASEGNGGINPYTGKTNPNVANVASAIKKYGGLKEDTILYRGVNPQTLGLQFGDNDLTDRLNNVDMSNLSEVYGVLKQLEGQTYTTAFNMPTDANLAQSFGDYPIMMEIYAEAGVDGAYIKSLSGFYDRENELLLGQNQNVKILNVGIEENPDNGQQRIVLKVLMPKTQ